MLLPNKANFSASSRNQDTSIRHDHLFSGELNSSQAYEAALAAPFLGGRQS